MLWRISFFASDNSVCLYASFKAFEVDSKSYVYLLLVYKERLQPEMAKRISDETDRRIYTRHYIVGNIRCLSI